MARRSVDSGHKPLCCDDIFAICAYPRANSPNSAQRRLPVSVLDCPRAEGLEFDPKSGLVAKPGEAAHPLHWFGAPPRPEDYILRRSRETLEGILVDGEWEGERSVLVEGRLRERIGRLV